jgi:hypothetical protein
MRLPNLDHAVVSKQKLIGYLISGDHPKGRDKAAYFRSYGFLPENWELLAGALREHAASHEIVRIDDTKFGTSYVVEGMLVTPDGRNPDIRAVWLVDLGSEFPRFITAYPLRRRSA